MMRRLIFAVAFGLFCAPAWAEMRAQPVELLQSQLGAPEPSPEALGPLRFAGGLRLSDPDDLDFGGLSGMSLDEDGRSLTVISDRGRWFRLRLRFDGERLAGAERTGAGRLRDLRGRKLSGLAVDSEELVADGDGWLVSFERRHRLWRYGSLDGPAAAVDAPAEITELPVNGGIEAATRLPDGRLLLLAEERARAWIGRPGAWQAMTYRAPHGFAPTAAAAGPDGMVYLIERRFTLAGGPEARLLRLPVSALVPGAELQPRLLAHLALPMKVDNFEAIALSALAGGGLRLLILSDNNFQFFQSTLLLSFTMTGPKP